MKRILALCLLIFCLESSINAQEATITIHALDGRTGKPLKGHRLRIDVGDSPDPSPIERSFAIDIGKNGLGTITFPSDKFKWLRIGMDSGHLCQKDWPIASFSVDKIMSTGLVTSNDCSKRPNKENLLPGHITVYARHDGFLDILGY